MLSCQHTYIQGSYFMYLMFSFYSCVSSLSLLCACVCVCVCVRVAICFISPLPNYFRPESSKHNCWVVLLCYFVLFHIDNFLYSMSYHHFGAPKTWLKKKKPLQKWIIASTAHHDPLKTKPNEFGGNTTGMVCRVVKPMFWKSA